jgi:hypothetical protein
MKTWMLRFGLSLMIVVGFWANRLPAQEILLVPEVHYEPASHPQEAFPFTRRPQAPPADHLARRLLNSHGMGCQADLYAVAPSSWRYEYAFAFSSSRNFFGYPCVPGHLCPLFQPPQR